MELDQAILNRHVVRSFSSRPVERELIEAILEAGRQAPFAGLAQAGRSDFRRFFVIELGTEQAEAVTELCNDFNRCFAQRVQEENLVEKYPAYCSIFTGPHGAPRMKTNFGCQWLVIAAERKGMPKREQYVLGYVMAQMWLKATELGLGFCPRSTVIDILKKDELCEILGLPDTEWQFDAFTVGWPAENVQPRTAPRPTPVADITWFTK